MANTLSVASRVRCINYKGLIVVVVVVVVIVAADHQNGFVSEDLARVSHRLRCQTTLRKRSKAIAGTTITQAHIYRIPEFCQLIVYLTTFQMRSPKPKQQQNRVRKSKNSKRNT